MEFDLVYINKKSQNSKTGKDNQDAQQKNVNEPKQYLEVAK